MENDSEAVNYTQENHISTLAINSNHDTKIIHWLKENKSNFIKFCGWRVNWLN